MQRPDTILPTGTRVRTHDTLESTDGLLVDPKHVAARSAGTSGTVCGVARVHGGDVYLVAHPGATESAAYCYTEFELEDEGTSATRVAA
jgi:hypothetical protein